MRASKIRKAGQVASSVHDQPSMNEADRDNDCFVCKRRRGILPLDPVICWRECPAGVGGLIYNEPGL